MTSDTSPLKVGLLLDDHLVSAWTHRMIEEIQSSDFASINLVILNTKEPEQQNNLLQKFTRNRGRIAYLAVRKVLEVIYSTLIERNTYLPDAEAEQDCSDLLKNVQTIKVKTKRKTWSDYFYDDDVQHIKDLQPDILIRCGFGILRGDILNTAKYGIWSFHHGDNQINRGGPAGFWETMQSWPETGSILQILSEDLDNGKVLYRSFSCTDNMSVTDNKSNYYWKSLFFMTRKMKQLHNQGDTSFFAQLEEQNQHPQFYSERLYKQPTNLEFAKLIYGRLKNKVALQYKNRFRLEQWILLYDIKQEFSSSLWRYKRITPPKDRFWADPHIIYRDNTYYIFIEEFPYDTQRGHISVITMDEDGEYTHPVPVLKTDYHLSYPYVFEYEGKTYMIPESSENRTIELYECTDFPNLWHHKTNLMENINAVDATLLEHDGRWWLFANVAEHESMSHHDELFVYYADSPLSTEWTAHKQNPVISDCKFARPAGQFFTINGNTYRPSQNCSHRYGYGFNINQLEVLTPEEYKETPVSKVKPNWDKHVLGTHTFNRVGNLHVIDALVDRKN